MCSSDLFPSHDTCDSLYSQGFRKFKIVPRVLNHFSDLNIGDCRKRLSWLYSKVRDDVDIVFQCSCRWFNDLGLPKDHECSVGLDRVVVGTDGEVYPCPFYKRESMGNIFELTNKEISLRGSSIFAREARQDLCRGWDT